MANPIQQLLGRGAGERDRPADEVGPASEQHEDLSISVCRGLKTSVDDPPPGAAREKSCRGSAEFVAPEDAQARRFLPALRVGLGTSEEDLLR